MTVEELAAIVMVTQKKYPDWWHGQCDPPDKVPLTKDEAIERAQKILAELEK